MPAKTTVPVTGIGHYPAFTGRLIVINASKRWQVVINWRASTPEHGWLRLTHAASGRIIEIEWTGGAMRLRDNQAASPSWRPVSSDELATHGIVLTPRTLATILLGTMPPNLKSRQRHIWEGRYGGSVMRLQWSATAKRLTITDINHGRKAILIIQD
ncbi:MAG: hypothetical protein Q9M29_02655 [Mariprofundaceae bacterium]|nr:hypothetical protein [Mariprofundaceae bacterium]